MKRISIRLVAVSSLSLLQILGVAATRPAATLPATGWSSSIAYAAAAKPPAKKAGDATNSSRPAVSPKPGTPSEDAKLAFAKLIGDIKQKIADAPDKEKAAREGLATLQKYAADHAREPISDTARLTAGHLQYQLGQTTEALAAIRQVAEHPIDKQAGYAAQLSLAQILMVTGKYDESEKILKSIIAKNEDPDLTAAAKAGLAMMAIRPGQKPPAITAKDLTGNALTLDQYAGKVLLIDFWATWCGPCREEMPNVKKIYSQYKDQGFAILGISLDRDQTELDKYIKEQSIEWPQVFEGGQDIAEKYSVTTIPHMLLLDRQGVIRYMDKRGPELEKAVAELVGGEKKDAATEKKPADTEKKDAPK
jgi:peroxiredoxin